MLINSIVTLEFNVTVPLGLEHFPCTGYTFAPYVLRQPSTVGEGSGREFGLCPCEVDNTF